MAEAVMQSYVGTKAITARAMTRQEYNDYRGWDLPDDEDGSDLGYLVEYENTAGQEPNHPDHVGYISWSPAEVFHEAYKSSGQLNFGEALHLLKEGYRIARKGWNGKGMFLFLVPGSQFKVNRPPLLGIFPPLTEVNYRPHIDMRTADGEIVPWVASQSDLLVDDWVVVEDLSKYFEWQEGSDV